MVGALLRYYVGVSIPTAWLWGFPVGTLLVNFVGSFLLSWFATWSARPSFPLWLKTGIATGFIGSFTTFSTFSVDFLKLLQHHAWKMALLYFLLSVFGGLLCSWSGFRVAKPTVRKGGV
nr:fluoride efflux transporter CrcB [Anoxybacillus amylolyticus]